MAYRVPWPGLVVPVIDAKKRSFFCAAYQGEKRVCPDMDAEPQEIAAAIEAALQRQPLSEPVAGQTRPVLLVGADAILLKPELENSPTRFCLGDRKRGYARELLELAPNWIERDIFSGPEYIRKSDAEEQTGK
jgi:tRNA threonylcarbamoyladenosine biosynthesis protein TsaB